MKLKLVDYDAMRKAFDEKFKETRQLIQDGETHLDNLAEGFLEADRVIYSLPTIDAVPVVRCAECIHYESCESGKDFCCFHAIGIRPDDFCSYGEQKGG